MKKAEHGPIGDSEQTDRSATIERWTASNFFFLDGDLERLFHDLANVHKQLAKVEGYPSSED